MLFSSLTKRTALKICRLCVCVIINKHSFEPFVCFRFEFCSMMYDSRSPDSRVWKESKQKQDMCFFCYCFHHPCIWPVCLLSERSIYAENVHVSLCCPTNKTEKNREKNPEKNKTKKKPHFFSLTLFFNNGSHLCFRFLCAESGTFWRAFQKLLSQPF